MRSVQVPGIDTTRHQIWTDTISDFPRLASSAAHIYGKPRAFTESFASYKPPADATMARYVLNEQFVRGVNMAELMYFPSSNPGGRPTTTLMTDPGLPGLLRYIGRLSYLMSMGRPTASVALYLPSSSLWLNDRTADTQFVSTERLSPSIRSTSTSSARTPSPPTLPWPTDHSPPSAATAKRPCDEEPNSWGHAASKSGSIVLSHFLVFLKTVRDRPVAK